MYSLSEEDRNHFNDTHEVLGLVIFLFATLQGLGGVLRPRLVKQNLEREEPLTKEQKFRKVWEVFHRVLGVALVCMAWSNCQSGIGKFADRFGDDDEKMHTIVFWCVAAGLTLVIMSMYVVGRFF